MSLNNNALVTLEEVREYFGWTSTNTDNDNFIESLINYTSDLFENYCEVDNFKSTSVTEYYDGEGEKYLFLNNIPIVSITSIYDDVNWVWGEDTIVASTDYRIVNKNYIVGLNEFTEGDQNIKVSYTYGYATIPGDLKMVCIEEVIRKFKNRDNPGVINKTMVDGSISKDNKYLLESTVSVLNKYRRMLVW